MTTQTPKRTRCVVPFCGRTCKTQPTEPGLVYEWICPDHWKLVPRERKRDYTFAKRRGRDDLARKVWARLVRTVIDKAAGL